MSNLRRILIVGDAGRGKTTLAQRLSEKLNIPKYSTDDYFYEVKFSKPRDKQEAIRTISTLYHDECWIVEGTTQWLWQPGLESADIILHLTYGSIFAQWYTLIKRRFERKNEESLGELFRLLKHVFYKRYGIGYRKGKIPHEQIIAPYKEKVTKITSFKEIDCFLNEV